MHKTVATQNDVDRGQRLGYQVKFNKAAPRVTEPCLIVRDQGIDNISANVVTRTELDRLHPIEVAARDVEQRRGPQALNHAG